MRRVFGNKRLSRRQKSPEPKTFGNQQNAEKYGIIRLRHSEERYQG